MSLLVPLFLAGLAAIAIPILVHLVHRERSVAERFPSAMFLRREPYRAMARQRLRHLFLFAMRVLAVALLAFAFSRPFFTRDVVAATATRTGKDVAIVLDRSASMGYGDRWARARAAVERTLGTLGADDRAALVVFDTRAAQVAPLGDREAVRRALATEAVSTRSTRYVPALQLGKRVLGEGGRAARELVLISDFQRSGWDVTDNLALAGGEKLTPIDVSGEDVRNMAWRGVTVERDSAAASDAVRLIGRVANAGPARRATRVTLAIGPRDVAEQRVDLPADGGATVTFAGLRVAAAANEARLVLHGDTYTMDDTLRLLLERPRQVSLLLVEPGGGADRAFFLRAALALGAAPSFEVLQRTRNALAVADFADRDVIVLHDAGWPTGAAGERLRERVAAGAGLVLALGDRSTPADWATAPRDILPTAVRAPSDRSAGRGATLGWIDRTHAALETFATSRSGDLSAARFVRYRPLTDTLGGRVLARFDDGAAALVERSVGRGRVLAWGGGFGTEWSDFPRQPVFLPFMHELMRYAAGYRAPRVAQNVGDVVDLDDALGAGDLRTVGQAVVAVAPSGRRERFSADTGRRSLALDEAGFFTLTSAGAPGSRPTLVAANLDPRESEFDTFDPLRLTGAMATDVADDSSDNSAAGSLTSEEREQRQSLWWWLLAAVTVVLGVEAVAAARAAGTESRA